MFGDALSSCSSTYPKQERIETNGDGVKPGSPHAGLGGANVQLGRVRPSLNIFTPSPFVSELYVNSNTLLKGYGVLKRGIGCTSREECCSPSNPGTPQNCLRRFCGEPHSGFPPPLEIGDCPRTLEYCLPPSCRFPPKSFPLKREPTISGDTFGTRAQGRPRTAPLRRRHVMPLAMRPLREKSGALPAHVSSALGTHTVAAALKGASPCERLVSGSTPNEITSCHATSRSGFL